jgi:hypothetical protein
MWGPWALRVARATQAVGNLLPSTGVINASSVTATTTATQTLYPDAAQQPYNSLLYSNGDKNGPLYCPAGTVMNGIHSLGYDNQGTIIAGEPLCSNWTAEAVTDGLAVTGAYYTIDSSANGGSLMCNPGDVVNGVEWAKNNQIDFGECAQLTSTKGPVSLGSSTLVTATAINTDYYCPPNSLLVGGKNAPNKNDSWNGFYCAPITISATTVTGSYFIPSSWNFVGPLPGGACESATCTGSQQTYTGQPLGTYTFLPVANSAGPLYVFRSMERAPIAERAIPAANPILSFLNNIFASVAKAFSIPSSTPLTQTLTASGLSNTANFIVLWDPVAQLGVSPASVPVTNASPTGTITVSNPGAKGSVLNWSASAPSYSGGPPGWLTMPSSGSVTAGSSQNITAAANTGIIPKGACTAASPCTATVTFSGTSSPNGYNLTQTPSVVITLTMSGGGTVAIGITPAPPTVVAAGVPVQVSCTGGFGLYTWSSTGPATFSSNTSVNGASTTVKYASPSSPTYTVTCTDKLGGSASTDITVVPDCTITPTQPLIVPPQSTQLNWSCEPNTAVSCTINGTSVCGTVATCNAGGGVSVSPATNTIYTLSCAANNGIPGSFIPAAHTTVSVQGPGVHETNP